MNRQKSSVTEVLDTSMRRGQCLCGQVVVQISHEQKNVGICHCHMCRRWTSGPWMALLASDDLVVKGQKNLIIYQSSNWAERAFCGTCGSNIYYRLAPTGEMRVSAGLFEGHSSFKMNHQVFIDKKPDFYEFSTSSRRLTSRYVIAGFVFGQVKIYLSRVFKR